jgi:uncharacterized protein YqeY
MSIVDKLKAKSIELRKARSAIAPSIAFALSEIERIGKNAGNRETTEAEAIRVVQKIVATINENIRFATASDDDGRLVALHAEKCILESVLPTLVTDDEISTYLRASFIEPPANRGVALKILKAKFGVLIDMKRAGEIVNNLYGV